MMVEFNQNWSELNISFCEKTWHPLLKHEPNNFIIQPLPFLQQFNIGFPQQTVVKIQNNILRHFCAWR